MNKEDFPISHKSTPYRQQILEHGIKLTVGDRNKSYGDPVDNLGLAGKIKMLCRDTVNSRQIGPAEMEALDMVITKLARCFVGSAPGVDTYVDMATYAAIAGECAELERAEKLDLPPEGMVRSRPGDTIWFPAIVKVNNQRTKVQSMEELDRLSIHNAIVEPIFHTLPKK